MAPDSPSLLLTQAQLRGQQSCPAVPDLGALYDISPVAMVMDA